MRSGQTQSCRSRRDRLLVRAELLLVAGGTAILVCCAGLQLDAYLAQRSARLVLAASIQNGDPTDRTELMPVVPANASAMSPSNPTSSAPTSSASPASSFRPWSHDRLVTGEAIATLTIARVGLSAVVLHGSDPRTLRRGPGHLAHTALPGDGGNVVIAGHRDSFFRPLREVRSGDQVRLDTPRGRFVYRVSSLRVINPRDVSVLAPTASETLTLITCYPFWVFGNAPDRFVVTAVRTDAPAQSSENTDSEDRTIAGRSAASAAAPAYAQPFHPRSTEPEPAADVRRAIERFRFAYNWRVRSGRERNVAPLPPQTCDVTMVGAAQAFASCHPADAPQTAATEPGFTFVLANRETGWTITAVVN